MPDTVHSLDHWNALGVAENSGWGVGGTAARNAAAGFPLDNAVEKDTGKQNYDGAVVDDRSDVDPLLCGLLDCR